MGITASAHYKVNVYSMPNEEIPDVPTEGTPEMENPTGALADPEAEPAIPEEEAPETAPESEEAPAALARDASIAKDAEETLTEAEHDARVAYLAEHPDERGPYDPIPSQTVA